MADVQGAQPNEQLPPGATKHKTRESQAGGANGVPGVDRLDGKVARLGEHAYSGGEYCEVWLGRWEKRGYSRVVTEKVSLSLATAIPLMWFLVGRLENTESTQVARPDT